MVLAIILVDWTRFCRVLRAEVLVTARRDYVTAARLSGFSHWRTLTREVLPATLPLLITLLSLEMGIAVIVEAVLSFVGMGVRADEIAWGQMIADARQNVAEAPWTLLAPMAAIFVTVTGFNLLGDGLRRALDVRLREAGAASAECRRHDAAGGRGADGRGGAGRSARAGGPGTVASRLPAGRVLGLVGESGAGKSMVGRAIAQALPPGFSISGGSLALADEDLVRASPARRRALLGREIAFIPQEPMTALNPVMSIGAQIAEHLRRLGVPRARNGAGARWRCWRACICPSPLRCCDAIRISSRAACASAC